MVFLHDGDAIGIVAVGSHSSRVVDGEFEIIAEFGPGQAFGRIFVIKRRLLAGEIDLRRCGPR